MKKIVTAVLLMILIVTLSACNLNNEREKPLVMTTLFPQYDITRALAGDLIDLEFLIPAGTDAHSYEPTPRRVVQILEADLLIYTGDQMEPWVSRLIKPAQDEGLNILDLSRNLNLRRINEHSHDDDDHEDDDHNHEIEAEIGEFKILNRRDDNQVIAYVHGDHWDGLLPNVEIGESISLGAFIVSSDDRHREFDSEGEINSFTVSLYHDAEEGIVELIQYGDHVHINGLKEGITHVVFNWVHRGEIRYTTPPITVTVGDNHHDEGDDHHDHNHDVETEIGEFEILNRRSENETVAYVHGPHWHGSLPTVEVGESISLGAYIVSVDDRHREFDSEGEINSFTVSLYPGAEEGIVELIQYGDHVHINGLKEGITQVVFNWVHRGEIRYTTPPINVTVGEAGDDHGLIDPHVWTDPLNLAIMVISIRNALIELLPDHEAIIRENANQYLDILDEIHDGFLDLVQNSSLDIIMYGGHNAMGYFMDRYQLSYVSPYRGFSTDAEPTPQALAHMIDTMNEYGIQHLFSEKLISPHVASAIAEETGATILFIYAMENAPKDEFDQGITLFDMMRHNLEMFKIGLIYQE